MQNKLSKLKAIRLEKGMLQLELAKTSGVKLRSIQEYEIEHRDISCANIRTIVSLSEALDIPFYELLNDDLKSKVINNLNKYSKPGQ